MNGNRVLYYINGFARGRLYVGTLEPLEQEEKTVNACLL